MTTGAGLSRPSVTHGDTSVNPRVGQTNAPGRMVSTDQQH